MTSYVKALIAIPHVLWPVLGCTMLFVILLILFWRSHRGVRSFYFDPQDFAHYEGGGGRELPVAASQSTFADHLRNYVDVTKLQITVAAASIAFGGSQKANTGIQTAKIVLAFSILFGVLFSALLQFFYDEYSQDVRAYTRLRYSLIESLGFSALACFIAGYFVWAFNLG